MCGDEHPQHAIDNAWSVRFMPPDGWGVAGPFATSEEAHAYSMPRGGIVVFNCETDIEAIEVAKRAIREQQQKARIGSDLELSGATGEKGWRGCPN